jgi:thymidylate synthase
MGTKVIEIENGVNGYVDLAQHVLRHGEEVAPRGMKTREIEDAVIFIDDVYNTLPLKVGRNPVPGIGAVEACQLLSGTSFPETVIAVGPQFKNYAEDNGMFHGSYGTRTQGQYAHAIEKLKSDNDSRQAVVTIWNPSLDNEPLKRDYPCTVLHQFRIRNNRLNMSVYMRSNDVWLGAAYDFFQFTRLQIAIASVLGIEPGKYAHHAGSLHIYEQHYDAAEQLTKTDELVTIPVITSTTWSGIEASALGCLLVASGRGEDTALTSSEAWYADAMLRAIERNKSKQKENP